MKNQSSTHCKSKQTKNNAGRISSGYTTEDAIVVKIELKIEGIYNSMNMRRQFLKNFWKSTTRHVETRHCRDSVNFQNKLNFQADFKFSKVRKIEMLTSKI